MKTSPAGIKLICHFEDCKLKAYLCPAGIPTVGDGHTGSDVTLGLQITQQRADELLASDLAQFEAAVSNAVHVPLTQAQYDALVSFVYNLGAGTLKSSRLLRLLNRGDYKGAASQFKLWCHAGAEVLPGLVLRRAAEEEMFNGGDPAEHHRWEDDDGPPELV